MSLAAPVRLGSPDLPRTPHARSAARTRRRAGGFFLPPAGAAPYIVHHVRSNPRDSPGERAMSMFIGEALVGDGNEVAHIDLLIGSKDGPVGHAFATALANQSHGLTNLLAVLTPNLLCKPATVLITKVTIKGLGQAVQMFGPAQAAVARAVS